MTANARWRHARMPIYSAVLMVRRDESWSSEIEDISATGVRVTRPAEWDCAAGDCFVLDMIIGDELNIHLEASVARVGEDYIGFAYERIPEDKETALWGMLGGYADRLERIDD